MCELLVGPLWRVRRERVSVWQSRSNDNLPVCECGDQLVCHSQSGFHTIREDEATRVQSFYVLRNALKSRVKWFPHQIKNKAGLAQETSYRAPWSQPIPEGSVNVTYNPNTSLLNWLWATAARFCLPNHVCLSLDRSAPKCLSLQNKPTPQHASSWGCGEEVGRGGKRGLRIWGIKLRRNIQQLPAGITRVTEMTAPHGSCYQAGLLIGRLDCREKRLVQSTVVWSHIIHEKRCRQKAVSPVLYAL